MTRLAELYEDRSDAVYALDRLLGRAELEPEIRDRIGMAVEDVRSRIREIDDDIFDLERKEGVIGAQG